MLHEIGGSLRTKRERADDKQGEWAGEAGPQMRKTGDPKTAACLCVMGDLNPQPAD